MPIANRNRFSAAIGLIKMLDKHKDYVILHKLVRIIIKNHSKEFWTELEIIIDKSKVITRKMQQKFILIEY